MDLKELVNPQENSLLNKIGKIPETFGIEYTAADNALPFYYIIKSTKCGMKLSKVDS